MGLLEEVIYLADITEENRRGPEFEAAREAFPQGFLQSDTCEGRKRSSKLFPGEHNRKLYQNTRR